MNFSNFNKIILGSGSPRRKQLLEGLGLSFSTEPIDADESFPENLKAEEIAVYLSIEKAKTYKGFLNENDLLITADTIVWVDNKVLNKPSNQKEAKEMLQILNNKTHTVYTGVCLTINKNFISFFDKTEVRFANMSEEEMGFYIERYKPFDKAGSYGAQEWYGFVTIENINGSYFNVMGLPVHKLYKELKDLHFSLQKNGY